MNLSADKSNNRIGTSELLRPDQSTRLRSFIGSFRSWRGTVLAGVCLSSLVLLSNIGLLVWAYQMAIEIRSGILTLYQSDCLEMKKIITWSHLGINVLSSLLLSASTACMQCLSAPTRREVDRAHEQGLWLHLGVLGLRNFLHISKWRRYVWILLAFSSIPIHLLYNSIIFSTETSNDYNAFVVTSTFLTGGNWNGLEENNFGTPWIDDYKDHWQIDDLRDHVHTLTRLETADCAREYSPVHISKWRHVLAVTDSTNEANSLLYSTKHEADSGYSYKEIVCQDPNCHLYSKVSTNAGVTYWQITLRKWDRKSQSYNKTNVNVEYCLAQKVAQVCTVSLSSPILITVILCNFVKVLCLLITLSATEFQPFITTGDAIASFLTEPDTTTVGYGPISAVEIMKIKSWDLKVRANRPLLKHWRPVRHFWFAAASPRRWTLVATCCFAAWTTSLILLVIYGRYAVGEGFAETVQDWWAHGVGADGSGDLVTISKNQPISSNVLLANTPQLLISLIYVLYNGTFTCMLLTDETLGFASERKALRVSNPSGAQRSTYWLQLPYRYTIPLMIAMSLLHWLISQSFFLLRLAVFDTKGWEDPSRGVYGCGWSPLGLFFSVILGGLLVLALFANGSRRYTDKMPILSSCSLAISAACHKGSFEDEDMAVMPLQYGVLSTSDGSEMSIGFSGKEVGLCVEGRTYQ